MSKTQVESPLQNSPGSLLDGHPANTWADQGLFIRSDMYSPVRRATLLRA